MGIIGAEAENGRDLFDFVHPLLPIALRHAGNGRLVRDSEPGMTVTPGEVQT